MKYEYAPLYQYNNSGVVFEKITDQFVETIEVDGQKILKVKPGGLAFLAERAFTEMSFYFRKTHLAAWRKIIDDPESSRNDRYVAQKLIENAVDASEGVLPVCQDTGTATVIGYKGEKVWTNVDDKKYLSKGILKSYTEENLRYSQVAPLSMFKEKNTGNNLPAQIDIYSKKGSDYTFLFVAKGAGCANKTRLYPMTKALLNEANLSRFLKEEIGKIGTTACPPYYLAVVIGGTSAEENLKIVKLASTEYLDHLPTTGDETGRAFRDLEWEEKVMKMTQELGIGAQFGGKYFAHRVVVIRLPRHGASCPVGIGVSCSAHRNILAKITEKGFFLEKLEKNPQKYLPEKEVDSGEMIRFNLNRPMEILLKEIATYPAGTKFLFNGDLIVARDMAHAKLAELLSEGKGIPDYFKKYPIYYAGPSKTPAGMPTGSFGPTTSNRMDPYLDSFNSLGASMISIGKGDRTEEALKAFKKYGSFYFGSIGGASALLAKKHIRKMELVAFEEFGMEAIQKISVVDFPVVLIYDKDIKRAY